jgi:branched-chain amino acid transport system permease protein
LAGVLLVAVGVGALFNMVTERAIFRPLRGASSQAPLIATIGLALFLREFMRLAQGSRDRWLQPIITKPYLLVAGEDYTVSVSTAQIEIVVLTVALSAGICVLLTRSDFGRRYRACCDDLRMARLLGVNVDRTVIIAFGLSAVFAGAAGAIIALYYGTVSAYMGMTIGFKALVAAVIGGIGSIAGAMFGGLLIGLLESFWSAYITLAYRDVVIFGLLAVGLIFRPAGLLGQPKP